MIDLSTTLSGCLEFAMSHTTEKRNRQAAHTRPATLDKPQRRVCGMRTVLPPTSHALSLGRGGRPCPKAVGIAAACLVANTMLLAAFPADRPARAPEVLPGTSPLDVPPDPARAILDSARGFLQAKLDAAPEARRQRWEEAIERASDRDGLLKPLRKELRYILGVRDPRPANPRPPRLVHRLGQPARLAAHPKFDVFEVRWAAFARVEGQGLLLEPHGDAPRATVLLVPDADQSPEQFAGLRPGLSPEQQLAGQLAARGCRVLIPALVSRTMQRRRVEGRPRANLSDREFIYRPAFELGRHVIGYELQMLAAAVDAFARAPRHPPIVAVGYGEGGALALFLAALDTRVAACCVSGYVDRRENAFLQPIDRNVFRRLLLFGDAELMAMIAPRPVLVEAARGPVIDLPGEGGAPARLRSPRLSDVRDQCERARRLIARLDERFPHDPARQGPTSAAASGVELIVSGPDGQGPFFAERTRRRLFEVLATLTDRPLLEHDGPAVPRRERPLPDPEERRNRLLTQLTDHSQAVLHESPYVRKRFFADLDTSNLDRYRATIEKYRAYFRERVIGWFDDPPAAPNARTRIAYRKPGWTGYHVVLDVFADPPLIAYGILLVPAGIRDGERRPVVVCQHGLEGRPTDTIEGNHPAYHDFAARLAERGFVVFAPQNLYIYGDDFRTLQRMANPLGKTLFSIIAAQHRQIVDWLQTLPFVDPQRIGFYGLSYGGKTAMRVPALVTDYALSICSADFNDWVWKNASTRAPYSYVWTGEYEIFEFDLGSTFNYAEMAALIAPRPFMVERGHFDGVAPDERVAYEYAKVRHLYAARLKIPERTEIEWFVGPHTIHGVGTFRFLHRHLRWPEPAR
ncbi:MAG: hypothetical protein D6725_04025 [Planctomycetota bacterium]|nr:MAG: hypothetical protein D6725_04025 [Planctomycetota bacterium]